MPVIWVFLPVSVPAHANIGDLRINDAMCRHKHPAAPPNM